MPRSRLIVGLGRDVYHCRTYAKVSLFLSLYDKAVRGGEDGDRGRAMDTPVMDIVS